MPDLTYGQLAKATATLAKDIARSSEAIHGHAKTIADEAKDTARIAESIGALRVDSATVAETRELARLMDGIAAAAVDYAAAGATYPVHWGRVTYFPDGPEGPRPSGQLFPYLVRDAYGQTVVPEDLGNVEPEPVNGFPTVTPDEIVARAAKAHVVRDGYASFFFHPFYDPQLLDKVLTGIERLGYRFVAPCSVVSACPRR
jgi:hypothetical protein